MKFKDLKKGDKFISYPDDDNDENPYYIFIKIDIVDGDGGYKDGIPLFYNAVKEYSGILSNMTDNMKVVKIK